MIANCSVFSLIVGTLISVCLFGTQATLVSKYPKLVIIGFGFAFSHLCCKMQVCTITKAEYFYQYTKSTLVSCISIIIALILVNRLSFPIICLDAALVFGMMLNTVSWFSYAYRFAHELAEVLGIYILKVGKRFPENSSNKTE